MGDNRSMHILPPMDDSGLSLMAGYLTLSFMCFFLILRRLPVGLFGRMEPK